MSPPPDRCSRGDGMYAELQLIEGSEYSEAYAASDGRSTNSSSRSRSISPVGMWADTQLSRTWTESSSERSGAAPPGQRRQSAPPPGAQAGAAEAMAEAPAVSPSTRGAPSVQGQRGAQPSQTRDEAPTAAASSSRAPARLPRKGPPPLRAWEEVIGCGVMRYMVRCPGDFARLLRSGLPQHLRWQVWRAVLQIDLLSEHLPDASLPSSVGEGNGIDPSTSDQIKRDVCRTFPDEESFNKRMQLSLGRILMAYARHRPSVGYVQGMNYIAGLLLLVSRSEREAFLALVSLMDFKGMAGFFLKGFPLLERYKRGFLSHMSQAMPDLLNHLESLGVLPEQYLVPWFMTTYIKLLPLPLVKVVWDIVICEGLAASIRIATGILRACRPMLLCVDDMQGMSSIFTMIKECGGATGMPNQARSSSEEEKEQAVLNSFWARWLLTHILGEVELPGELLMLTEAEEMLHGASGHSSEAGESRATDTVPSPMPSPPNASSSQEAPRSSWRLLGSAGQRIAAPLGELAADGAEGLNDAWQGLRRFAQGAASSVRSRG